VSLGARVGGDGLRIGATRTITTPSQIPMLTQHVSTRQRADFTVWVRDAGVVRDSNDGTLKSGPASQSVEVFR
jgi:hypothetical protein